MAVNPTDTAATHALMQAIFGDDVKAKTEFARQMAFKMDPVAYSEFRERLARTGDVARHS